MRYLELPGLGKVSQIGLGTGRFGSVVSRELSFDMLDAFTEAGGNVIDTARNYYEWTTDGRGRSEKTIGAWLSRNNNRDSIILCTKGGVCNEGNVFIPNLSLDNLIKEARESLDALQTASIDVYFLHRDEITRSIPEIVNSLAVIKEITGCKILGVSNWDISRIKEAHSYSHRHGLPRIEASQLWWSIADYTYAMWNDPTVRWMDADTYEYMCKESMIAFAFTSQSKGFFQKALRYGIENVTDKLKERIATKENLRRLELIREYCIQNNVPPTAVVNSYITKNRLRGVALVSTSSIDQLEDILDNSDVDVDDNWLMEFDPR